MTMIKNLSRRDFLKFGGATLLAGALGVYAPRVLADETEDVAYQVFEHGRRDQAQVALSYDDCHLVKKLQNLEELLRDYPEIKVTFFPTGEALLQTDKKDAGIWQRFLEAGHEIGTHTFDHVNPDVRSTENLLEDYAKWTAALYHVIESRPTVRFGRPPYGSSSPAYREMCRQRGLVTTMWSASWGGELKLAKKNMETVENGDVILMHTSTQDVDVNSPVAFELLKTRGLRTVTMSELYLASLAEEIGAGNCGIPAYRSQTCPE